MNIEYHPDRDIVVIEGIHYAGELFRSLAFCDPGTWIRIMARTDGVLSLHAVPEETERMFDQLAGIETPTKGTT